MRVRSSSRAQSSSITLCSAPNLLRRHRELDALLKAAQARLQPLLLQHDGPQLHRLFQLLRTMSRQQTAARHTRCHVAPKACFIRACLEYDKSCTCAAAAVC